MTAMPRRCASSIICSRAPITPEIGLLLLRSLAPCMSSRACGLSRSSTPGSRWTPPAQLRDDAVGELARAAFVEHLDRLVGVSCRQHRLQLHRVRVRQVQQQRRRIRRGDAFGEAIAVGHDPRESRSAAPPLPTRQSHSCRSGTARRSRCRSRWCRRWQTTTPTPARTRRQPAPGRFARRARRS